MRNRIVVAVFGNSQAARDAIALGARLAHARHAEIVLAAAWVALAGRGGSDYERRVRAMVEAELDTLRDLVPSGVPARTSAHGAPSVLHGLRRLVRAEGDVLVFAAADLRRHGHGNLALETLHDAPCNVAVAPAGWASASPPPDVAVAWADALEAAAALEAGVEIAASTGGTLHVIHVLAIPTRMADAPWLDDDDNRHWLVSTRPQGEELLQRAVERVAGRVPVVTELLEGLPAHELAAATTTCGLVVMGSRGYGSVRRLVLGSTSAGLLREASVPVLIAPRALAERDAAVDETVAAWKR
jgi:nucleotide-binding universal stress UspA family protein